ncbi:MAG: hypothetical protein IT368_05920 [Candidatus Hydrogenedentes bacterium]|nr:hypothetical protein [Candidatus Hydrogenedentota bacterium]
MKVAQFKEGAIDPLRRAPVPAILSPMPINRYNEGWDYLKATALWVLLGMSLGAAWSTVTAWPLPSIEGMAAVLVYRFSLPEFGRAAAAAYWLLLTPLAGMAWVRVLTLTAPYFGGANRDYPWSLVRFSIASLPLVLPLFFIIWAGAFRGGFSLARLRAVALLQGMPQMPGWLAWVYVALGAAALVWHFAVYRRVFEIAGRPAIRHVLTSLTLFLLAAAGAGALLYAPIQRWIAPWL